MQRQEANDGATSRYSKIAYRRDAIDEQLENIFLEAHATPPEEIVVDLHTTDVELHGGQKGRFFLREICCGACAFFKPREFWSETV